MDATDKLEIRKQIKKLRKDMSQDDCQRISESICQRLFSLDTYKKRGIYVRIYPREMKLTQDPL